MLALSNDAVDVSFAQRLELLEETLTVDGEPPEHPAGLETTCDLINPLVIERHPLRLVDLFARLCVLPEVRCSELAVGFDRV